ncbi:hypothetical protein Bhyg_16921 [Pseudolycoriella hygida]|uniref:Uncharacterized protein n=1 Tax=Pseudolycoriella hygida TaxID=35572 RepID=A0A9Q0MLY8_9DIPT|nr:hypothetical protein Bhyg_16921 [Pseudolycoriella hygida]
MERLSILSVLEAGDVDTRLSSLLQCMPRILMPPNVNKDLKSLERSLHVFQGRSQKTCQVPTRMLKEGSFEGYIRHNYNEKE